MRLPEEFYRHHRSYRWLVLFITAGCIALLLTHQYVAAFIIASGSWVICWMFWRQSLRGYEELFTEAPVPGETDADILAHWGRSSVILLSNLILVGVVAAVSYLAPVIG